MAAAKSGGGGSAPTIRCRHHQRDNRLPHRSKRWQLLALLFVTLLYAALCGLVSGAAAAELNNVDPTEQRPLLLYIPMHVSEPLEHLQELCDRTLSKDPWVAGSGREQKKDEKDNIDPLAFDILLVVSGPSDASRNATERFGVMRLMLQAATDNLLPSAPRIFTDASALA